MDIQLLSENFYDYSRYIRGYSKETIRRYKYAIKFYCKTENIKTIEEVTEISVKHFFMYGRMERDWSATTFITYHKSLLVFFRWCVENAYLKKNYVDDIEMPKLPKELPKKLSNESASRVLDVALNYPYGNNFLCHRNHAIFASFIYAGLRKSELLNLRLSDVDIENLTIFVSRGKGAKDRIIPMSHTLAQILRRYLNERKKLGKTCPEFFVSFYRNQGYTDAGLKRLVRMIREVSKINFSVHKLRHTFATLMVEGGCDIYSLSRMMGHSDIKTTTIYLSATAEHLRSQMLKHPLN